MPLPAGVFARNCSMASRPPAEAPMPTMGNSSAAPFALRRAAGAVLGVLAALAGLVTALGALGTLATARVLSAGVARLAFRGPAGDLVITDPILNIGS